MSCAGTTSATRKRSAWWWEADQMVAVNDSVNGLFGNFWCSAVRCDRDDNGDRTYVTLRRPCLQASFGQYKRPAHHGISDCHVWVVTDHENKDHGDG